MAHIFFEKLERRQSTQSLYGMSYFPELLPPQVNQYQYRPFTYTPWVSWGNNTRFGVYPNSWFNPITNYNPFWNGVSNFLSPIRYSQALVSGFGSSPSIIAPSPIAPLPIAPLPIAPTSTYIPPSGAITVLYGIFTPIPFPTPILP